MICTAAKNVDDRVVSRRSSDKEVDLFTLLSTYRSMLLYNSRFNCIVVLATLFKANGFTLGMTTRRPGSSIQLAQVSDVFDPSRRGLLLALPGIFVAPSLVSAAVTDENRFLCQYWL
jgi:hypothetical protein